MKYGTNTRLVFLCIFSLEENKDIIFLGKLLFFEK